MNKLKINIRHHIHLLTWVVLLGVSIWNAPESRAAHSIDYEGDLKVKFFATSTLHDFEGEIPNVKLEAIRQMEGDSFGYDRWKSTFSIGADTLTTNHKKRDHKMSDMFQVNTYPIFVLSVDDVIRPPGTDSQATLPVKITILDKTLKVMGKVKEWNDDGDTVSFQLETVLSLESFGLKRPGTAFGLIRVGDKVRVEAVVHVSRTKPVSSVQSQSLNKKNEGKND
jgi:hypothetical protein